MKELTELAAGIKLLLMDVDGVLTDGGIFHVPMPPASYSKPRSSILRTASPSSG